MNKTRLSLLLGVLIAVLALTGMSVVYPSVDDLWYENPFWNGLSKLYVDYEIIGISDLTGLGSIVFSENSTLLILGPSTDFSLIQLESIKGYMMSGGRVVLADDFGTGNQVLESLGLGVRFLPVLLKDPLFREANPHMPIVAEVSYPVGHLVLNYPSVLGDVDGLRVTAWSSPFSYVEGGVDGLRAYSVMAEANIGEGVLFVISDSSLFINSMIDRGDNRGLLEHLLVGRVMVDETHSLPSHLTFVKTGLTYIYTGLRNLELRYGVALIAALTVLSVKVSEDQETVDEVEQVMAWHPEYDRRLVEWLHVERRKTRGEQ